MIIDCRHICTNEPRTVHANYGACNEDVIITVPHLDVVAVLSLAVFDYLWRNCVLLIPNTNKENSVLIYKIIGKSGEL